MQLLRQIDSTRAARRVGALLGAAAALATTTAWASSGGSGTARPAAAAMVTPAPPHDVAAPHDTATALSAAARAQLDEARRATAPLGTPQAAIAAGYRPMFGNVPLQGEHYVRVDLVMADSFDVTRPSVLIFAPVKGTPTLVGAAYAFLRPTDAPLPVGFDGAATAWHTHERLTWVAGRHLVMMHAWFVGAPDGPFARYNPWLPYYAAGLTPPSRATLADAATSDQARKLGFALALATQPPLLFEMLEKAPQTGSALRQKTAPLRDAIATAVRQLAAADSSGDRIAYDRAAAAAVRHADALVEVYRGAAPERPIVRRFVDRTVEEFMGRGHGIEEELDQLAPRDKATGQRHHEHSM